MTSGASINQGCGLPQSSHPVRSELDLRALAPPMPLLRSLELADALSLGEQVTVLTPLWPEPLFEALDERGLAWEAAPVAEGGVRVRLWRPRVRT